MTMLPGWTPPRSRPVSKPSRPVQMWSGSTTSHCSERRSRCTPNSRSAPRDGRAGPCARLDRAPVTASLREFLDGLTVGTVVTTVVDVALVYYLIYRLLLTIRGTRAAQMVVGIVLVGAAFFVAERLELSTVSWLLENLISYFIILIIVVFQQDIRRALGRIGQSVM